MVFDDGSIIDGDGNLGNIRRQSGEIPDLERSLSTTENHGSSENGAPAFEHRVTGRSIIAFNSYVGGIEKVVSGMSKSEELPFSFFWKGKVELDDVKTHRVALEYREGDLKITYSLSEDRSLLMRFMPDAEEPSFYAFGTPIPAEFGGEITGALSAVGSVGGLLASLMFANPLPLLIVPTMGGVGALIDVLAMKEQEQKNHKLNKETLEGAFNYSKKPFDNILSHDPNELRVVAKYIRDVPSAIEDAHNNYWEGFWDGNPLQLPE